MDELNKTAFLDCYMWEVKRYPAHYLDGNSVNYSLQNIYYYNSLNSKDFLDNYNGIHIPEFLIKNLTEDKQRVIMENLETFIKEDIPIIKSINDNEWVFDDIILEESIEYGLINS